MHAFNNNNNNNTPGFFFIFVTHVHGCNLGSMVVEFGIGFDNAFFVAPMCMLLFYVHKLVLMLMRMYE